MSDLPRPVAEAGLLFQRATIATDPEAWRQVIAWGYQQIDLAYPQDPIRYPLNLFRRIRARQEWEQVIRTAGKELRGTIATSMVRDLEFQIQRRQNHILADDAERRRQDAILFDSAQRLKDHGATSEINHTYTAKGMKLNHELNQEAEENASRRRIREETSKTVAQITVMLVEAQIKAAGTSSAAKTIETVNEINAKILEIRKDPDLTDDDKHLQIKAFLDALPRILSGIRATDV